MRKLILSALFLLIVPSALIAETTIHVTNGEWEPYLSEYSYQYGFTSYIVSESFKEEGINVKWGFFPWKRSLLMAKNGKKWIASCCWWPSEELKKDFYISEAVSKSSVVFFHRKDFKFDWKSIDDLKVLKIGGTFEYEYSKEFMDAFNEKKINVDMVPSDEQNFMKLLAGRIDIFPNDPIVGYMQIKNTFPVEKAKLFTHHPKELQSTSLHLIISKKYKNGKKLLEKFNSGLKKLKRSGRYDEMVIDLKNGKYDKQKVRWKK